MFNFIRKLFKALNSSGKSWQLSGAIVLAMFSGFLPTGSFILLDLLFLALILNVNFGLYLLFTVIFSGVGYLFDPLFESLGYMVLNSEMLNGFFTMLYNSTLMRWSEFNYTLVTGSLLVSVVLAIPMFFILNILISLYRVQVGEKLNEWKLTRWMKLFNEDAKTISIFRWWALGVYAGIFAVISVFVLFLFDPLAKMALEKSLSYSLQTEVSVKDFSSDLSDLSVRINGIEVADKDKLTHNLVQIEKIAFDLGFSALLEKKAMIEDLDVKAVAFDTKRSKRADPYTSTIQNIGKNVQLDEKTKGNEESSPFALPDVNDILDKEELKSVKEAQKLKEDIKATQDKWNKISKELKAANEVENIKIDAKKLEKSLKDADIKTIASASKDIKVLKDKIQSLKSKYANLQNDFNADKKRLQTQITKLKDLPNEDYNRLKNKYSLNASGGSNLVGTLVNDKVGGYMKTVLKYYEMAKPYLSDDSTPVSKEVRPPRGEGRWIKYANHSKVPELLIKKAKINMVLDNDKLDIDIKDLCSNQKLYGKPMTLHADAKGTSYKHILADMVDDRREDKAKTSFDIQLKGFEKELYDLDSLQMKEIVTDAVLKGELVDTVISAKSDIKVKKVNMKMPSQKLVNDLLASIHTFNVHVDIKGELQAPSIGVKSDLDKQLSKGLKSMASKEVKKFEKELHSGLMKKAGASSSGISTDLGDINSVLNSKQGALSGINLDFSSSSNPLKGILPF